MLVLAGVARGLLTVMFDLARSAWVAQRVDAVHLPMRNAQMSACSSLAETAAFALGGWLYQWLGAALALLIDAGSYLLSAFCLRGVRDTAVAPLTSLRPRALLRTLLVEACAGLTALAAVPTLRTLASLEVLVALGVSLAATSYMIFVTRDLGFATGVLGLIFATGGIGHCLVPPWHRGWAAALAVVAPCSSGYLVWHLGRSAFRLSPVPHWVARRC
jgi:hypothetical protein